MQGAKSLWQYDYMEHTSLIIIAVAFFIATAFFYFYIRPTLSPWLYSLATGAKLSLTDIARMRLEIQGREDIENIIRLVSIGAKAGIEIDPEKLEDHRQAGGDADQVVRAMIIAKSMNVPLSFEQAGSIDQAGRNLAEAVKMRLMPVVTDTHKVTARTKDGVELNASCRVTLQASIKNFTEGASREIILARVRKGVEEAVANTETCQDIIENPYRISDHIMDADHDADGIPDICHDGAFEILSIDIANVNLGENNALRLKAEQTLSDAMKVKDEAEKRYTDALRHEEDIKVRAKQTEADLIAAEAEISRALAEAIIKNPGEPGPKPDIQKPDSNPETRNLKPETNNEQEPKPETDSNNEQEPESQADPNDPEQLFRTILDILENNKLKTSG